jgi:hypothetical protein
MKTPLDSSELAETAQLFGEIISAPARKAPPVPPAQAPQAQAPQAQAPQAQAPVTGPPASEETSSPVVQQTPAPVVAVPVPPVKAAPPIAVPPAVSESTAPEAPEESAYRGDRLENTLAAMCKRGEFSSAVIADNSGLPLAAYNTPDKSDEIAAFATILGETLVKASTMLDQPNANNVSLDINYSDKAVLRRFMINEAPYYLFIICPQEMDERSEVELSVKQISSILS